MCRLYGFRANAPSKVDCSLVKAQNALLEQSRRDERGLENADGWGIAYHPNGTPKVLKRYTAAHADVELDHENSEVSRNVWRRGNWASRPTTKRGRH